MEHLVHYFCEINIWDLINEDLSTINGAIEKCDSLLECYKSNKDLFLNNLENYSKKINNLENNRNILIYKKTIIETLMNGIGWGNNRVHQYYCFYGAQSYGFAYNYYVRSKNSKYALPKRHGFDKVRNKISLLLIDKYREYERYVDSIINCTSRHGKYDARFLVELERNYRKLKLFKSSILVNSEAIASVVDDLYDLDIDNLDDYIFNNPERLLEIMCEKNIITNYNNHSNIPEEVFLTIYQKYADMLRHYGTKNCAGSNPKSKNEVILELFWDDRLDYMYNDEEIEIMSKFIDFTDLNIDKKAVNEVKKEKSYKKI